MMRIIFLPIISILLVLILSGCDQNDIKVTNTVSKAELTGREDAILSTLSEQPFIFDFNVDDQYKELRVRVEKYEFGKLVKREKGFVSTDIKDKGTIMFAISKSEEKQKETLFNIAISDNAGNISSSSYLMPITTVGLDDIDQSTSGQITEPTQITKNMVLANISYSKGLQSTRSLSSEFYKDVEGHIEEIKDYDVVYLLRATFSK